MRVTIGIVHDRSMAGADAAVAILHARDGAESVLLIRRAEREGDPWSGHWSFPGGRCDPSDVDSLETALRELWEECGIRLERSALERAMPPTVARRRLGPFVKVSPFVFGVNSALDTIMDVREVAGVLWAPLDLLRDPERHVFRPAPALPADMLFPCIELPGPPLWGFTYRLITDWLGLLPKDRRAAGIAASDAFLEKLLMDGFELEEPWSEDFEGRRARVRGRTSVSAIGEILADSERGIPRLNAVEIQPDSIRLSGLEFEDAVIQVRGTIDGAGPTIGL